MTEKCCNRTLSVVAGRPQSPLPTTEASSPEGRRLWGKDLHGIPLHILDEGGLEGAGAEQSCEGAAGMCLHTQQGEGLHCVPLTWQEGDPNSTTVSWAPSPGRAFSSVSAFLGPSPPLPAGQQHPHPLRTGHVGSVLLLQGLPELWVS